MKMGKKMGVLIANKKKRETFQFVTNRCKPC